MYTKKRMLKNLIESADKTGIWTVKDDKYFYLCKRIVILGEFRVKYLGVKGRDLYDLILK